MEEVKQGEPSCEKCLEMKRMHYPRPSCEECGFVEPSKDNLFVWELYARFQSSMVSVSGFGGYSVNVEGVRMIAEEEGLDALELLERVEAFARELLRREDKDGEEG